MIFQGPAFGFAFGQSSSGAVAHNANMFFVISLPALALGALTRSIGQDARPAVRAGGWHGRDGAAAGLDAGLRGGPVLRTTLAAWLLLTLLLLGEPVWSWRCNILRRDTGKGSPGAGGVLWAGHGHADHDAACRFALEGAGTSQPGFSLRFAPEAGIRCRLCLCPIATSTARGRCRYPRRCALPACIRMHMVWTHQTAPSSGRPTARVPWVGAAKIAVAPAGASRGDLASAADAAARRIYEPTCRREIPLELNMCCRCCTPCRLMKWLPAERWRFPAASLAPPDLNTYLRLAGA